MKVFVAYGYNSRDEWVEEMVFPIIRSFGSEVIDGKETFGKPISDDVRYDIRRSDALIAFTSKRNPAYASATTHRWVIEELALAFDHNLRVVEVREKDVDAQDGMTGNLQRIEYVEERRDRCLVEIVKALGKWHQSGPLRIQLLPESLVTSELRPLVNELGLSCSYIIKRGNHEQDPVTAPITPISAGLFIDPPSVPRDALIRISISFGEKTWVSAFEPVDAYGINLKLVDARSRWRIWRR